MQPAENKNQFLMHLIPNSSQGHRPWSISDVLPTDACLRRDWQALPGVLWPNVLRPERTSSLLFSLLPVGSGPILRVAQLVKIEKHHQDLKRCFILSLIG
jgi:hypothetical protein